ncbi:MAG: energy-coupling factor transporter transmembrane protein EcfT [Treponema sp.]|jgi:energy-coupling factor transport system permease protein|nr:energy-coupling factor transporter transmembrane protein EcfT [Treponema sp.]
MTAIEHTADGSFLCRLDPRTKITLALFFTLVVFIVDRPFAAAVLALGFLGLWFAAKLPFKTITVYARRLLALMVLAVVLQTLFGPGERYMLKPLIPEFVPLLGGRGSLKWDGLVLGAVIVCRLVALMLLFPMLTMTTSPRLLALGLTKLGMPYRAAYIVTTALNLIPAFEEDARIIMDAQKLRGMRAFEEGTLPDKFRAYPALAIPLLTGAMRRAQLLGAAMDARAFGAFKTKSWLDHIRMAPADYWACAAALVFASCVLILHWAL